ncbi:MAG: alpha-2-macroglobulin family protein [Anaerolineae bacterium]
MTPTPTLTLTPTLTVREAAAVVQAQESDNTATPAASATATWTLLPTATPEPTPTDEPTATPPFAPTGTPEPVPTGTPEPASTGTPEPASTDTPQPEPTAMPQPEASATPTAQPTAETSVAEALIAPAAAKAAAAVEIPLESLPIIRERFPQTLYWNPEIVTDAAGRLAVTLPTGNSITTWRINALAVDRTGRLGSATAPLVVFQPLFMRVNMPARMTIGEQSDVRIQIFNYSAQAQTVQLAAQSSAGLRVTLNRQALIAPANDVITVTARVQAIGAGQQTVLLTLTGTGILDTQQATILVQ